MSVQLTDETGLEAGLQYYFRYNVNGAGYIESSIIPETSPLTQEVTKVQAVADVSGSLESTYFLISSPTVNYYAWMNAHRDEILAVAEVSYFTPGVTANEVNIGGRYWTLNSPTTGYYVWFNRHTTASSSAAEVTKIAVPAQGTQMGTVATLGAGYSNICCCILDSTYAVGMYSTGASPAKVATKVGTRTGNSIAWGSEYTLDLTYGSQPLEITTLDSTHAFIVYQYAEGGSTWTMYGVVITISGTTISYGTPVVLEQAYTYGRGAMSLKTLDSTHVILAFVRYTIHYPAAVVATISGTTVTWGTVYEFSTFSTYYYLDMDVLDSTHAALVYVTSATTMAIRIATISGTTISYDTPYPVPITEGTMSLYAIVQKIDSTHFMCLAKWYSGSTYGSHWRGWICTNSSGVITYAAEKNIPLRGNAFPHNVQMCQMDSTHFGLVHGEGNTIGDVRLEKIWLDGTTSWGWGGSESSVNANGAYPRTGAFNSQYLLMVMYSSATSVGYVGEPFKQSYGNLSTGKHFLINSTTTPYMLWLDLDNSKVQPTPLKNWSCVASNSDGTKIVAAEKGAYDLGVGCPIWPSHGMVHRTDDSGTTNYILSKAGSRVWTAIACSNDGTKIFAGGRNIPLWHSTDSGSTWSSSDHDFGGTYALDDIDCSSDGTYVIAVNGSGVFTSSDSGATLIKRSPPTGIYNGCCSSSTGAKMAICPSSGYIAVSSDYGASWTQKTNSGSRAWRGIACSSDGAKLVAIVNSGYIYTSTDSGDTWTERTASSTRAWIAVCSSDDGVNLAAAVTGGYIYTSTDSGAGWTERTTANPSNWSDIDCSTNGSVIIASVSYSTSNGHLRRSTDSGATWSTMTLTTPIEVDVTTGDSATTIATNIASALDGKSDLVSTSSTDIVTVTNASNGNAKDYTDESTIEYNYFGLASAVSTQGADTISSYDDTDPAPGGTGIEVRFSIGDTTDVWRQKVIDAINTDQGAVFTATIQSNSIKIDNDVAGAATDITIGTMNDWMVTSSVSVGVQGVTYEPEYNSTDPAPSGKTGIETRYTENDSADTINSKLAGSINAEAAFNANFSLGIGENWGVLITSTSNNSKYWIFDCPDGIGGTNKYYVWFNINGGGTDPGPVVGRTGVQVVVTAGKLVITDLTTALANKLNTDLGSLVTAVSYGVYTGSYALVLTRIYNGTIDDDSNVNVPGLGLVTVQQGSPSQVEISRFWGYPPANNYWPSDTINNKYWLFDCPDGVGGLKKYYVWYNINSLGIDPNVDGRTGIEVNYPWTDPTESEIRTYTRTAIINVAGAYVDVSNTYFSGYAKVYVVCDYLGNVDDPQNIDMVGEIHPCLDSLAPTGGVLITNVAGGPAPDASDYDTGFTISTETQGLNPYPLTKWSDILTKLNVATTGATWSLYQGDIRLTSNSTGPTATLRIASGLTGLNLFESLTGWITFDPPKDPYPA